MSTCSSAFYYIHNIRRIRKYLSRDGLITLVHSFVTSRLDYCNSLYYGLPNSQLIKLQRVQNAAARLVCNLPLGIHITPSLQQLHWLPVQFRVKFKILLLTFKAIHGLAPKYLVDLIHVKTHSRYSLRSNGRLLLDYPGGNLQKTTGDCSFVQAAPTLWNFLPSEIQNANSVHLFKTKLKTHLFRQAFLS